MPSQKDVDIRDRGQFIRSRTFSAGHEEKIASESDRVAQQVMNSLMSLHTDSQLKDLVGDETDVAELQELTEAWITEVPEAEEELARKGFDRQQRESLFQAIKLNIRPRKNN